MLVLPQTDQNNCVIGYTTGSWMQLVQMLMRQRKFDISNFLENLNKPIHIRRQERVCDNLRLNFLASQSLNWDWSVFSCVSTSRSWAQKRQNSETNPTCSYRGWNVQSPTIFWTSAGMNSVYMNEEAENSLPTKCGWCLVTCDFGNTAFLFWEAHSSPMQSY